MQELQERLSLLKEENDILLEQQETLSTELTAVREENVEMQHSKQTSEEQKEQMQQHIKKIEVNFSSI